MAVLSDIIRLEQTDRHAYSKSRHRCYAKAQAAVPEPITMLEFINEPKNELELNAVSAFLVLTNCLTST